MLNQGLSHLWCKCTFPFELAYNQKPDSSTWFELFSMEYIPVDSKNSGSSSYLQAHTFDSIDVGQYKK